MTSYVSPASLRTTRAKYLAFLDEQLNSIQTLTGNLQDVKNLTKRQELEDLAEKIKTRINIAYDEINSSVESYKPGAIVQLNPAQLRGNESP
jgi:hypothetical protein